MGKTLFEPPRYIVHHDGHSWREHGRRNGHLQGSLRERGRMHCCRSPREQEDKEVETKQEQETEENEQRFHLRAPYGEHQLGFAEIQNVQKGQMFHPSTEKFDDGTIYFGGRLNRATKAKRCLKSTTSVCGSY